MCRSGFEDSFDIFYFGFLFVCILMDFPITMDTISMGLSIVYFKGPHVEWSIL